MTGERPLWVDYHCHLDLYPDHGALAAECDKLRIATLAVTTTPKAWERNLRIAERFSMLRVGLGLHPQVVAERANELPMLLEYLPSTRYIGEVGLDASPRFYASFKEQERIFTEVLAACRISGRKILSVHSVRSAPRVLAHIQALLPADAARVVLHWFTGSAADADKAIRLGCYFSINSAMIASDRGRALIKRLPKDRLLTETDGPFVRVRGQVARPSTIPETVELLAGVLDMTPDVTAGLIIGNLSKLESFIAL